MTQFKKAFTIFAIIAMSLTSNRAEAQAQRLFEMKVKMINTPISKTDLVAVLREGHMLAFGKAPSESRLAMGWAQVAFENGQGKYSYDHNLGNVGPSAPDQHWYFSPVDGNFYRSYDTFQDGAKRYWEVVGHCKGVLERFDIGAASEAAQMLKNCGYFGADIKVYTDALNSLYWTAHHTVIPQEKEEHERQLQAASDAERSTTSNR